ncbi:unnamed protein product, partial [Mesorhabditis spiculigera]
MSFGDLKELPHLVKPLSFGITILLFIFVLVAEASWYPILIASVLLIFTLLMLLCFAFDVPFVASLMWPKVEMVYSMVFAGFSVLGGIIMFIQIFDRTWFASIVTVGLFAVEALVWAFNALQMWRNAPMVPSSGSNQATAAPPTGFPPSGINPGV